MGTRFLLLLLLIGKVFLVSSQPLLTITGVDKTKCTGSPCAYSGPSILINEIMLSPSLYDGCLSGFNISGGECQGEWIELYNPDFCNAIDISCYFLGNSTYDNDSLFNSQLYSGGFVIPPGSIVPANGFAIIRGQRAEPVPANLLASNGGNTIEIIVNDSNRVCLGGGARLWFPNSGGWFAFYDRNGVPQDAISWVTVTTSAESPCNPNSSDCAYTGQLVSYDLIAANRKNYISNYSPTLGLSFKRGVDGGVWDIDMPSNPTYGTCNGACIISPPVTCDGQGKVIATGGSGAYTYLWDNGSLLAHVTDLCVGVHTVTVTDQNTGQTNTASITINDPPNPHVQINPQSIVMCSGATEQISATGATSYIWAGNNISNTSINPTTVSPTITSNYTVTGTDANQCTATSSILVTVNPVPTVNVISDQAVCEGSPIAPINFQSAFVGSTFTWTNNNTAIGLGATGNGDISSFIAAAVLSQQVAKINYTATLGVCESAISEFTITVNPIPIASAGLDDTLCSGSSITLNGSGGTSCEWTPSSGLLNPQSFTTSAAPTTETIYTLTVWDNGCSATDDLILSVKPVPVANAGVDVTICAGEQTTLNASGGIDYAWNNSSDLSSNNINNPIVTTTITKAYTVTVSINGCWDTASVHVAVNPLPLASAGNDVIICSGDSNKLIATGGNGYLWSNGSIFAEIKVSPATTSSYQVTVSLNNCTATDEVAVTVYDSPEVNFVADTNFGCAPLSVFFTSSTTLNPDEFLWDFGDRTTSTEENPQHQFVDAGTYNIQFSATSNGCKTTLIHDAMITVFPVPDIDFTWRPLYGEEYDSKIDFMSSCSSIVNNYVWNFGEPHSQMNTSCDKDPSHTYLNPNSYSVWLKAENSFGCKDTVEHLIEIKPVFTFYIPNAFTPEGNELNEEFGPFLNDLNLDNFSFIIYNRWGGILFESTDVRVRWDGKSFKTNELCPPGVYNWRIIYTIHDGQTFAKNGMVTLVK